GGTIGKPARGVPPRREQRFGARPAPEQRREGTRRIPGRLRWAAGGAERVPVGGWLALGDGIRGGRRRRGCRARERSARGLQYAPCDVLALPLGVAPAPPHGKLLHGYLRPLDDRELGLVRTPCALPERERQPAHPGLGDETQLLIGEVELTVVVGELPQLQVEHRAKARTCST